LLLSDIVHLYCRGIEFTVTMVEPWSRGYLVDATTLCRVTVDDTPHIGSTDFRQ